LEAARFEAKKVVMRLLRDHEAWGQVSREGRPKEKAPDTRRNLEAEGKSITPPQVLSWFASEACAQKGTRPARGSQKRIGLGLQEVPKREGHATSTPTGSDREQRL
jgi:hypothetical protein